MATADYSWPNSRQAKTGREATVVDTDPPDSLSSWPNRNRPQVSPSGWPIQKVPQRRLRKPLPSADRAAISAQRSRPVGRWVLAFSLWAFAAGLLAGPALSSYGDRCLEAAIPWIASWAPAFLRPYLPKPLEAQRPLPGHVNAARMTPATPAAPERPAQHSQPRPAHVRHAKSAVAPSGTVETGDPFELHQQ
jgi:hypothetical protein